jgi:hypothetical protein
MKSIFLTFSAIVIAATAIVDVKAQYALSDSSDYYINPCPNRDYKNPCSETVYEDQSNKKMEQGDDHSHDGYIRVVKNFRREFPRISNEYWYKTPDGYIASFQEHAVQTKVAYNKKGRIRHTISYYGEKNLPHDIWENVKSSYYAYDILNVAEVHTDDQTIYVVYMHNDKYSKTVRVLDGDTEEVQNLKRG